MNGIAIVVIILVPIVFQMVLMNISNKKRHEEIIQKLNQIEKRVS